MAVSKERELDQLLNKKIAKKTIQLRVMIEHEVFGEEELIKEYFQQVKQSPNKQIPKDLGDNLKRSYNVQCSSLNGILIVISKEDFFKIILNKMKQYQIDDLVGRVNEKLENIEYNIQKIKSSMTPYKQYFISESLLDDEIKYKSKSQSIRPKSGSYIRTPKVSGQNLNNSNDVSISLSKRVIEFSNNSINQEFKKSGTLSTRSINTSQILSNRVINDTFSDKISNVQRKDSFYEQNKSNLSQNETPQNVSLNRQRNKSAQVRFFENDSPKYEQQENTPRNQFIKRTQTRPPSASLFCTMKKISSQNLKSAQYINSFSQFGEQNDNVQQQSNQPFFKDSINEIAQEDLSKIYTEDRSMMGRKKFSVFEKSTMETSFNVLSETLKSPRMRIQLGIPQNNNISNHKSLDILSIQDKKIIQLENKLSNKTKDNSTPRRINFIQFVPQIESNGKQDKVIQEKDKVSITYQGLNAKVLETVKRKVKIELIQPIFDRGYAENFKKEMIKINKKNTKFNYLVDVKEENQVKKLDKFSLLSQIREKQNKIQNPYKLNQDIPNNASNPNQLQINTNSNNNSNFLSIYKDNYQNNSFQVSETTIMPPPFIQKITPRQYLNANSNFSSSITSPIVSPRATPKSVQPSPNQTPKKNKNSKNAYDILSQLVDDQQPYPIIGFTGFTNSRPKSFSIKSPNNNNSLTPNIEQQNILSPRKFSSSIKERSQTIISRPSIILVHKKTRLLSPSPQNSHILQY